MATLLGCRKIIILYIYFCLQIHHISAQTYLGHSCYSENSTATFESNLNTIISSVSANVDAYGFYNGTVGDGIDQVNAIALCRGDIDIETCRGFVKKAAQDLTTMQCPNQIEAIIWYDECMFRYSNISFLGTMSLVPAYKLVNTKNAPNVRLLTEALTLFANNLVNEAYNAKRVKFASGNFSNADVETLYGFMQCTPDINTVDCKSCLESVAQSLSDCCYQYLAGARWITPSCSFRYETYSFIKERSNPDSSHNLLNYSCTNTIGNYTQDSLFYRNLNEIISLATSGIGLSGFYNRTLDGGVDRVNGFAFCWEYFVDDESCRRCINDTANDLTKVCPNQKEAIGLSDDCMFRYSSNMSINGVMALTPFYKKINSTVATNAYRFSQNLSSLADRLIGEATDDYFYSNISNKYIAAGHINISNGETIYGLMQCTPDINNDDCESCLNHTKNELLSCCDKVVGATYHTPSCAFRFEIYPFFIDFPPNQAAPPPLSSPSTNTGKGNKTKEKIIIVVCAIVALLVLTLSLCVLITRRRRRQKAITKEEEEELKKLKEISDTQTRRYDFALIRAATADFSTANKLGQGGFGEVYKGVLSDGKEIAVKRLSRTSGQGESEFMNEVISLAKLQHKCLVKLLGFCLEQRERLLIYEFIANGGLDKVLFDPVNRSRLDWERRYKIIKSVARGILYLHEDSRMMIIHRDLKASNILLDEEMNAKISDFGTARLFVLDEGEVFTERPAGTLGYMAPEYAMHGLFSVKSDVYSYGVLLLEIICGKKTYSSLTGDRLEDLPAYAYKTWKEDKASDLIDQMLITSDSDSMENMMRCIHIALLCVQESVGNRPTMAAVVHMLQSSTLTLPTPSEPGFFISNTETVAPHWSSFSDITDASSSNSKSKSLSLHSSGHNDRSIVE